MQTFKVETGGERLDKYLTQRVNCTRSRLKHAKILLNGAAVKSGTTLRAGDVIEIETADNQTTAEPENVDLDIIYEDDYLLIINKPRGMVVHPGAGVHSGTVLNALLGREIHIPRRLTAPPLYLKGELLRAGIVHRLDKNTAGLMVVAKTAEVQAKLGKMFEAHAVRRTYIGLVEGVLRGEGTIDKNIVRDKNHRTLFTVAVSGGRRAITHYTVLRNFSKWTLVKFDLETGRTHQIRVHCKSIGHAIVGDPEYNPNSSIKNLSGQMLESVEIEFMHPKLETRINFKTNYGEEFQKTVDRIV